MVIRHEKDDTNILDTYLPTYLSLVVADLVREVKSDRETHKVTVKKPLEARAGYSGKEIDTAMSFT